MPYIPTFDRTQMMMCGAEPDFRTVSDFRKDNINSLKEIFHEFNRRIPDAGRMGILFGR